MTDAERLIDDALAADRFFAAPPGRVRIERTGRRWCIRLDRPDGGFDRPIVEAMLEPADTRYHVTVARHIRMRGGEWIAEKVGTIPSDLPGGAETFATAVSRCVGFALAGSSRLGITSIETPHPAFALGMLAYLPHEADDAPPTLLDRARSLEARLRAGVEPRSVPAALDFDAPAVVRVLFNHLALSPYTPLVDRLVDFVLGLGRDAALDCFGYMLRHLARHLNAFDLVRFHNQGANYPDALMLDAVLRACIPLLRDEDGGDDGSDPLLRRALRQGWLARRRCEGLRVPDRPTSPGDAARDLPSSPPVLPIQLTDPSSRSRRLFHDAPAGSLLTPVARRLLAASVAALLVDPTEVCELGTAVFLDRPLGLLAGKRDDQPDWTALLSYEAVSPRMIRSRLDELHEAGLLSDDQRSDITIPSPAGFPVARLPGHARKSAVALEDAKKVNLDFVFTRTTRSSLATLLEQYDASPLNAAAPAAYQWLAAGCDVLLVRTGRRGMTAFDADRRAVFRIEASETSRCVECAGVEYVEGLQIAADGQTVPLPPRIGG